MNGEVFEAEHVVTINQQLKEDWVALGKSTIQDEEIQGGSQTDKALARFFKDINQSEMERLFKEREAPGKILMKLDFSSMRKRTTCAYLCNNGQTVRVVT